MARIGITTTVPIEILMAAGHTPVDLNNLFITGADREDLVGLAERTGFPLNCCTWIKGIYGVVMKQRIDTVLCVTTGDCSNTQMLMEVLQVKGINTIPFAYPENPNLHRMQYALEELAERLNTTVEAAEGIRSELSAARQLAHTVDESTRNEGLVSGFENHFWLVSSADFNGDVGKYVSDLRELLQNCRERQPFPEDMLRLAYIGVPPVYAPDLHSFLERNGARVVFNEVQRQFAMPTPSNSLAEQYTNYTYPYTVFERVRDITTELKRRRVQGVIHYVQTFCHRGIADIIFRHFVALPLLLIEGETDYTLTQHLRTRIEAFLDMVRRSENSIEPSDQAVVAASE